MFAHHSVSDIDIASCWIQVLESKFAETRLGKAAPRAIERVTAVRLISIRLALKGAVDDARW